MESHREHWSWNTSLTRLQSLYLLAVSIAAVLLALFTAHAARVLNNQNKDIRMHALLDCRRNNIVAQNQIIVVRTLLLDRLNKPGYLLYTEPARRAKSINRLNFALKRIEVVDCGEVVK